MKIHPMRKSNTFSKYYKLKKKKILFCTIPQDTVTAPSMHSKVKNKSKTLTQGLYMLPSMFPANFH